MMHRTLGRGALVAPLAAVLLAGCTTSTITSLKTPAPRTPVVTTYSTTPQVHDGRFTASFKLDGGGLLVLPVAASYVPQRNLASVRTQAWATSQIAPFAPYVVGLGRVTIIRRTKGVPLVRNQVAWVALAKSSDLYSCTAYTPPTPKVHPPSDGWSAVVIGDAPRSPSVVYQSASIVCNRYQHTTAAPATEVISTPWTLTSGGVVATAPSCSTFAEVDFGSSPTSTSFRYQVTIPEDRVSPAIPGSQAMPKCCRAVRRTRSTSARTPRLKGLCRRRSTSRLDSSARCRPCRIKGHRPPAPQHRPSRSTRIGRRHRVLAFLGYLPGSNGTEATIFSWSGHRFGSFHAGSGQQILESNSASALSPSGESILVERGTTISAMTVSGRLIGRFNADYGVLWGNDSVQVCALRLPAELSATSTKATLILEDPGHGGRVVAQVPGTADHTNTWLVACNPAQHVAAVETSMMGRGYAVTYVNLKTGALSTAPWYRPDQMGTVEISGDSRFAVTEAGQVVQTSTGKIVAHVAGQPIAISWLGHVVVVMADDSQNPEVVDWITHKVLWRYRTHVERCPCSSTWAIASSRMNSDDVAVNVPIRADRAVALWLVRIRASALHLGSVAPLHP